MYKVPATSTSTLIHPIHNKPWLYHWLFALGITLALMANVAHAGLLNFGTSLTSNLPEKTVVGTLGEDMVVNGLPMEVISIEVPMSIKDTTKFFTKKWHDGGWTVSVEKVKDSIAVMATDGKVQQVAMLNKTGEKSTSGSLSLSNMPELARKKVQLAKPLGSHLPRGPTNTMVINEVQVRDDVGESILTTLANPFDVEQNTAYYRERMAELGWKETRYKTNLELRSVILGFTKGNKEASFTIVRHSQQTLLTVNWIIH